MMNTTAHLLNYQLGLLHFAHLLVNADGRVNELEEKAIRALQQEEQISEWVIQDFQKTIQLKSERELFQQGVRLLNQCTEDEKIGALAHLYCLAGADNDIHIKEVRLLLYSLKLSDVEFEDVELTARMVKAGKNFA